MMDDRIEGGGFFWIFVQFLLPEIVDAYNILLSAVVLCSL